MQILFVATAAIVVSSTTAIVVSRESVRRLQIPTDSFKGFHESWQAHFPESHDIYTYNARDDPAGAARAVASSFAHATKWLPADVVTELLEFPFSPDAPVTTQCLEPSTGSVV